MMVRKKSRVTTPSYVQPLTTTVMISHLWGHAQLPVTVQLGLPSRLWRPFWLRGLGGFQIEQAESHPHTRFTEGETEAQRAQQPGLGCKSPGPAQRTLLYTQPPSLLPSPICVLEMQVQRRVCWKEARIYWIVQRHAMVQRRSILWKLTCLQLWTFPANNLIKPGRTAVDGNNVCILPP